MYSKIFYLNAADLPFNDLGVCKVIQDQRSATDFVNHCTANQILYYMAS
jgi:hypothetical protein